MELKVQKYMCEIINMVKTTIMDNLNYFNGWMIYWYYVGHTEIFNTKEEDMCKKVLIS